MSTNEIYAVAATIAASLYLLSLINTARKSSVKRELYVLTALLMAYFVILAIEVLFNFSTAFMIRFFRPVLISLWLLNAMTLYVESKQRGG